MGASEVLEETLAASRSLEQIWDRVKCTSTTEADSKETTAVGQGTEYSHDSFGKKRLLESDHDCYSCGCDYAIAKKGEMTVD